MAARSTWRRFATAVCPRVGGGYDTIDFGHDGDPWRGRVGRLDAAGRSPRVARHDACGVDSRGTRLRGQTAYNLLPNRSPMRRFPHPDQFAPSVRPRLLV